MAGLVQGFHYVGAGRPQSTPTAPSQGRMRAHAPWGTVDRHGIPKLRWNQQRNQFSGRPLLSRCVVGRTSLVVLSRVPMFTEAPSPVQMELPRVPGSGLGPAGTLPSVNLAAVPATSWHDSLRFVDEEAGVQRPLLSEAVLASGCSS